MTCWLTKETHAQTTAPPILIGGRSDFLLWLYREGEAPAEPLQSSAGASLSRWIRWQVVFSLPIA